MNRKRVLLSLLCAGLLASGNLLASPLWKDSDTKALDYNQQQSAKPAGSSLKARVVELNMSQLKLKLGLNLGLAARPDGSATADLLISIPLPEGGEVKVKAEEVSVMAPELAKRYPQIKTWRVIGVDDSSVYGRIDITEHGFHGMLGMSDGDTVFIEPDKNTANQYLSFSKRDNSESFNTDFQCKVHSDGNPIESITDSFLKKNDENTSNRALARVARSTITYRLAVAATGEYTQFHGGTKSSALSAIATTINRVNQVYERDLSINLELISGETSIIYTNPATDPYTDGDVDAMIDENLLNLSSSGDLSKSSYDIGHVFGAGNVGGLASLGSACDSVMKAGGVTGTSNPIGDAFSISFVAHEIGHQLGATHTFNSSCGGHREPETAYEPGSGSTVMAYAGVCGEPGSELQSESDPQFHVVSIAQIDNYTRDEGGATCGSDHSVSNQDPVVDAGANYTIPTRTPFSLEASGSDSDGDSITYTWEQFDSGTESAVDVDTGDNAIFRSRPANTSSIRYIPRLTDLANNIEVKGELLAANDRDVNFVVTARDGKGGIDTDDMTIRLKSTGRPFSVTSHSSGGTLNKSEETTVRWDVAGTDNAPISCQDVNIWLIQPSGDNHLLATTANDGREDVTLPDSLPDMDAARFLVACNNSIFYNISSADLTVEKAPTPPKSSGGGSMGYFLLVLLAFGLKRFRRGSI